MKPVHTLAALLVAATAANAETVAGKPRIVDGDTLEVAGAMVRLHGIDTSEPAQPLGKDATNALARLAEGKEVHCEGTEHDDFKRLLAICHAGQVNLNEEMVREGMAWAFVKYSSDYVRLEKDARSSGIGIWKDSPEPPWEFRAKRWDVAKQDAPGGCPIKGNINDHGERVYHVPWSPWYAKTAVNEAKGERWFCSEGEALGAGWRAPYWR